MFETKQEINDAVQAIYAILEGMERGQVLMHEEIGKVLGLSPHEGRWDHIVKRARDRLEVERGIATWPMHTVGYELLSQADQLELPTWRLQRAIRQIRRARKSTERLPERGLTQHQRRVRLFNIERSRDTERSMRREMLGLKEQLKPTGTLPRRPPMPEKASLASTNLRP